MRDLTRKETAEIDAHRLRFDPLRHRQQLANQTIKPINLTEHVTNRLAPPRVVAGKRVLALEARRGDRVTDFMRDARRDAAESGHALCPCCTLSQAVRAFGLRRTRYRGLAKTGLQHAATAAAINLDRITAWFGGRPIAPTRISRFANLAA